MELNATEIERSMEILRSPKNVTRDDAALLEKMVAKYPYFSSARLLLSAVNKTRQHAELASIYTNGKISKRFYEMDIAHPGDSVLETQENEMHDEHHFTAPADDTEEVFEEISEINTPEFYEASEPSWEVKEPASYETPIFKLAEPVEQAPVAETFFVPEIETVTPDEPEHATVSKYDDDKLPYTFLWWLAKTRAEYEPIFQPYAAPVRQEQGALQQQYVEHIFHLQTGVGLDDTVHEETGHEVQSGKTVEIMQAFLSSDPQIRPPSHSKLDNENKARKSAEDHNDVVSETLASIYIEQMLYRKAIDTYEKLSLKFPEKSRYFADLIKSLEKKI